VANAAKLSKWFGGVKNPAPVWWRRFDGGGPPAAAGIAGDA